MSDCDSDDGGITALFDRTDEDDATISVLRMLEDAPVKALATLVVDVNPKTVEKAALPLDAAVLLDCSVPLG